MVTYKQELIDKIGQMKINSKEDMEYMQYFKDCDKDFAEQSINAIYDCRLISMLKNYKNAGKISTRVMNNLKQEYKDTFRPRNYRLYRKNKYLFADIMGRRRAETYREKHSKVNSRVSVVENKSPKIKSVPDRRMGVITSKSSNSGISKAIREDFLNSLDDKSFRNEVIEALSEDIEKIVTETLKSKFN